MKLESRREAIRMTHASCHVSFVAVVQMRPYLMTLLFWICIRCQEKNPTIFSQNAVFFILIYHGTIRKKITLQTSPWYCLVSLRFLMIVKVPVLLTHKTGDKIVVPAKPQCCQRGWWKGSTCTWTLPCEINLTRLQGGDCNAFKHVVNLYIYII